MPADTFLDAQTVDLSRSRRWYALAFAILAITLIVRALWYPVIVSDYTYFIKPWFDEMQSHAGLTAFAYPFADYAPMYLYLLKLLSVFPFSSLISAKTLSLVFDALIAYLGYQILKKKSQWGMRKDILFLAAVVLMSLPTVMMNSSLWSQSDAIYTSGVIASLLFILIGAPLWAAVVFGLAISFKIQAIFFAPVLLGYLLRRKETWKYLAIPPGIFILSVLPTWIAGGPLSYWLFIYVVEAEKYPYLSVSAQSIFAFAQPLTLAPAATNVLFWLGIAAAGMFALFIAYLMKRKAELSALFVTAASLASVLVIPYLLPRMHERYFYLADSIAVLYAFFRPSRFYIPILIVATSLISYMPFLSPQVSFLSWAQVDLRLPAALLAVPLLIVLIDVLKLWKTNYARP